MTWEWRAGWGDDLGKVGRDDAYAATAGDRISIRVDGSDCCEDTVFLGEAQVLAFVRWLASPDGYDPTPEFREALIRAAGADDERALQAKEMSAQ